MRKQLKAAAPDGIDVYFDNVGGDHLEAALELLQRRRTRGALRRHPDYNATERVAGPANMSNIVTRGLTLHGLHRRQPLPALPRRSPRR